jgi:hypothetical protein
VHWGLRHALAWLYSLPWRYLADRVDARTTPSMVQFFHHGQLIKYAQPVSRRLARRVDRGHQRLIGRAAHPQARRDAADPRCPPGPGSRRELWL